MFGDEACGWGSFHLVREVLLPFLRMGKADLGQIWGHRDHGSKVHPCLSFWLPSWGKGQCF